MALLKDRKSPKEEANMDQLIMQIDEIIQRRQDELFNRLSSVLSQPLSPPDRNDPPDRWPVDLAVREATVPDSDSPDPLDPLHALLHEARLEDSDAKMRTSLHVEASEQKTEESRGRKVKKKRWQVNSIPLLEEEDYEVLADERSRRRAARTAHPDETETKHVHHEPKTWSYKLAKWVISKHFEGVFAAVIFSNSIFLGISLEFEAGNIGKDMPVVFKVFDLAYLALFLIELLLKIWVDGRNFFCAKDRTLMFWNYLDLTIVCTSLVEVVFDILLLAQTGDNDNRIVPTNLIRVIRIVRILRVMRVIKVVKFISGLTSLISSILSTLKSLLWSLLLLLMVMYVFGILFTDNAIGFITLQGVETMHIAGSVEADLMKHFGSLHSSMHTLFRSVTGGVDWGNMAELLVHINWFWGYVLTGYIAFSYFTVLNVMTAVFCKRAIESAEQDEQNIMQRFHDDQRRLKRRIEQLFHIFDGLEEDGAITLCELESFFDQDEVRAIFQSLDLSARDSWTLFKLLDEEGNGDINLMEFMDGCLRLRGPAKALDIACVMDESRRIKRKVILADQRLKHLESNVAALRLDWKQVSDQQKGVQGATQQDKRMAPDREFDLPYDIGPHVDFDVHPQIILPGVLLT